MMKAITTNAAFLTRKHGQWAWMKQSLKRLRSVQPLNFLATTTVRRLLAATGLSSECVIRHLHRMGTVRCTLPNGCELRLWSRGDDWVANQIYWRGWPGYEPESSPLFFRLAAQARVTLDVGAYVGYYALLAGHANRHGKVYAFEPMPAIRERLLRNVVLNHLDNIECVASAVGETDGEAEMFHVSDLLPSSSSLSQEFMRDAPGVRGSIVPVTTLDRFVRDRNLHGVDLVKIDTESTETQVLRGMTDTLRRDRPAILCEVLQGRGTEQELTNILYPLGYRFYLLTLEGPRERDRIEGHPEWLNYLFTPLAPNRINAFLANERFSVNNELPKRLDHAAATDTN